MYHFEPRKETSFVTETKKFINFNERDSLLLKETTITYKRVVNRNPATGGFISEESKDVIQKDEKILKEFPLKVVSVDDLVKLRYSGKPGFLLKENEIYYYAKIDPIIRIISHEIMTPHLCGKKGHECRRLAALSDAKGGCAKVRDKYKYIENYSFITKGFETFNTDYDSFVVFECSHYKDIH